MLVKNITISIAALLISLFIGSCTKDNYQPPSSVLYGSFLDEDTHELVEQDIIQGTQIELVEKRYSSIQFLVVKNDGTFRNSMLFENEYKVIPVRGNFEPIDTQTVNIKGETELNFNVKPYIRIKNLNISIDGDIVKATFNLQQTGSQNVQKIGLFVSPESAVGATFFVQKVELPVGGSIDENETLTVKMDLSNSGLKKGKSYYFRVGAIVDLAEAKYNYAKAVQLPF